MPFQEIIGHSNPITWLQKAMSSEQLAHAYLFSGEHAIGKRMTAMQFIQSLNCDTPPDETVPDSCGHCRSCQQIMAHIHPDVLFIQPDHEKGARPHITIDSVREIEHHVIYRPLIGLRKICLIDDADRLTIGAANALLKTLEEPPDHCLFILITSQPMALLSTLRSRCLTVRFCPPSREQVIQYLQQHRNLSEADARFISFVTNSRLGEALQLDLDETKTKKETFFSLLFETENRSIVGELETAEALSKSGQIPEALTWLWSGLRDLLLLSTGCTPELLLHQEHLATLEPLAQRTPPQAILNLLNELYQLEQGLQRNLNMQLGFERFFLNIHETLASPTH